MNLLIKFSFLMLILTAIFGTKSFSQRSEDINSSSNKVDSLYQPVQISFLPWLSTSGTLSAQTYCRSSFNIISGITGSVNGLQLGSTVNIVRKNAGKAQFAGIGNITGLSTSGIQCAGIINLSKVVNGVQLAGVVNHSDNVHGVQISGVANYVHDSANIQLAGVLNHSTSTRECQLAGVMNNTGNTKVQVAGIADIAKESPVQIAGVFNRTSGNSQLQMSGTVNITGNAHGLQAGIINIAKKVNGVQIGVINIADSCQGIPVGVINIIRSGYHVMEISSDELFYANISFRSGIEKFHSILITGIRPDKAGSLTWTYGSGFGSLLRLSERNKLGIDLEYLNVIHKANVGNNYLLRAGVGIDHKLASKTSLYLGFTGNWLSIDRNQLQYKQYYSDLAPYYLFGSDTQRTSNKIWLGAKLGLRLF